MFKTSFDSFTSVQSHTDHSLSTAEQLESVGQPFEGKVIDGLMLGGLPDQFKPLILGIQGSSQDTTDDFVPTFLLQDNVQNLLTRDSNPGPHFSAPGFRG